jgi:MFS family permease
MQRNAAVENDVSLSVKSIKQKLQSASSFQLIIFISLTSFTVYSCMYGFRKPYTSASFGGLHFWGLSYKSILIISQSIGYLISKWIGIRFIATTLPVNRAKNILLLIVIAWIALLLFAITPAPYNCVFMFINGLPLGMVWGLVFGYLEGRVFTDIMGAVLATSFIFASGFAKTIGKFISINFHLSDMWMPFFAGALFIIPAIIAVTLLNQSPPPTETDIEFKTARKPMVKAERRNFLKQFGFILIPVCLAYVLLTVMRDFCEDFSNELWIETGHINDVSIFTQTGTYISLIVLFVVGSFFLIKNNYKAHQLNYLLITVGFACCIISTILFQLQIINSFYWFLVATTGMYLGYVSYNCIFFERMIATFKVNGTVGFVMYIADAVGYLGALSILVIKEMVSLHYSWIHFFTYLFYAAAFIGIILIIWASFLSKSKYSKTQFNA